MGFIALIPAYNEAERIGATVAAAAGVDGIDRVVVIDDGSDDATADLATRSGAIVVTMQGNSGKGAALDKGLDHARASLPGFDGIVLLDGDLGETASEAMQLLEPVVTGLADMTIATFPRPTNKAGFGLVMGLAAYGIRRYGSTEFDPTAPLSGQRVLSRATVDVCTPFAAGYGVEVALTAHALKAGLRVLEVPTTMSHAATGRDLAGFLHRGRQFLHVALTIIRLSQER